MFGSGKSFKKSDYKEDLDRIKALFKTNKGEFTAEFYAKECPETVWNFINLAEGRQETVKKGPYYNDLSFHRVIKGFMIQGGCPDGIGSGTPGYQFEDECHPELLHTEAGLFSMANTGRPKTNGSQFFITLAPTPHLNGKHTVFGKVIEGMDVINKIGEVNTDFQDRPEEPVIMEDITIIR